jgi:hypothetical protein
MSRKEDWWANDPDEIYWCEITDRPDLGADLKCPQHNEKGGGYWSYELMLQVQPGDIIFHYLTPEHGFVGASVAGGPIEDRIITWAAHGTVGRSNPAPRSPRAGWWRPLYGYRSIERFGIEHYQQPAEMAWIRNWMAENERAYRRPLASPFQRYASSLM